MTGVIERRHLCPHSLFGLPTPMISEGIEREPKRDPFCGPEAPLILYHAIRDRKTSEPKDKGRA